MTISSTANHILLDIHIHRNKFPKLGQVVFWLVLYMYNYLFSVKCNAWSQHNGEEKNTWNVYIGLHISIHIWIFQDFYVPVLRWNVAFHILSFYCKHIWTCQMWISVSLLMNIIVIIYEERNIDCVLVSLFCVIFDISRKGSLSMLVKIFTYSWILIAHFWNMLVGVVYLYNK